jgi:hypothetical protein
MARGSLRAPHRELAVERDPQLLVDGERKPFRHHADDGGGLAVEADGLAHDVGRASEVALPDAVADERDLSGSLGVVGGGQVAPHHGHDPERAQEVLGHVGAGVALRLPVDGQVDGGAGDVGGEQLERFLLRPQLLEVHRGHAPVEPEERGAAGIDEIDAGQPVGVGEGEAAQHDAVHDAEHRGHAPYAERERGHGQGGEGLLLGEDPQPDAQVTAQILDEHVFAPIDGGASSQVPLSLKCSRSSDWSSRERGDHPLTQASTMGSGARRRMLSKANRPTATQMQANAAARPRLNGS